MIPEYWSAVTEYAGPAQGKSGLIADSFYDGIMVIIINGYIKGNEPK
jgi:hypothetical protein